MLVVGGVTYRIERAERHCYTAVRLLDDCVVGRFRTGPVLRIEPIEVDASTLRDIVRAALRAARTSAVMHAAPVFQPDSEGSQSQAPSTAPPPSPVPV
jgi:hypothetical protein